MNTFPFRSGWRLLLMLALGATSLYGQQFDGVLRGHEGAVLTICSEASRYDCRFHIVFIS